MISMFFFFSSRRRHTRLTCDWSSDVCSSDLRIDLLLSHLHLDHIVGLGFFAPLFREDLTITIWRSEERRVGKSVDLGGRRIIKKKSNIRMLKAVACNT